MKIKLLLVVVFLAGCATANLTKFVSFKDAVAKTGIKCHYTHFVDGGEPNIGRSGKIEYDEEWKEVLSKGFKLHSVNGLSYMFEKCM